MKRREYCPLCITDSLLYSDIGECLSFGEIPLSEENQCVESCLHLCVFFPSVFVGRFATGILFNVHHPGRMESDVLLYLLTIHSTCILSTSSEFLLFVFKASPVYLLQNGF